MKIYIGRGAGKFYGRIILIFSVILAIIVGVTAFMNRNGEYSTMVRENGDIHVRVTGKRGKEIELPKEYPTGIINLYQDMKIYDVWLEFTPNNEPLEIVLEVTSDNPKAVVDYYNNTSESLLNPNYTVFASDHGEYGITIRVNTIEE